MGVESFDDFERFRALHPGVDARLVLTERGRFQGMLGRTGNDVVRVTFGHTSLPNTVRMGVFDKLVVGLLWREGGALVHDGQPMRFGAVAWSAPGSELRKRDLGGAWCTLSFPFPELDRAAMALYGGHWPRPRSSGVVTPPPERFARLLRPVQVAMALPGEVPGPLAGVLLHAAVECLPLVHPGVEDVPGALARKREVVAALAELAEEAAGLPLPLAEVCARLDVRMRTLNASCQAMLGMGAATYLRRSRLHAAFSTLRRGEVASVTEAASLHGFWDFGRFAADYRALFGERPSQTRLRADRN